MNIKQTVFGHLYGCGLVVARFRPEVPGVTIPPNLVDDELVTLNYSYRFKTRIVSTDEGIEANLSFGGVDFPTFVPWDAIVQMASHEAGMIAIWPAEEAEEPEPEPPKPKTKLEVVK